MKVASVQEMRSRDRAAIERFGIPEEILMENAGMAVVRVLRERYGIAERRFVVLCGTGNNGGDGLVVARHVHSAGGAVAVVILGDPTRFSGAAALNLELVRRLPIVVSTLENAATLGHALRKCDVVVDAIFGTGLTRPLDGRFWDVVEVVNACGAPVVAVDIPSGLNGDTGQVMGTAVRADCSVSFGLPKMGAQIYPGVELAGDQYVCRISFPPALYDDENLTTAINVPQALPTRKVSGHKGDFGDALFVAGAANYYGAPGLAAMSFLKAGGGYARLATPRSVAPVVAGLGREIVFLPQDETAVGSLSINSKTAVLQVSGQVDLVVIGPGLSTEVETGQLVRELVAELDVPILVDGDGITALCGHADVLRSRRVATILTPHLGELSRLTGKDVSDIQSDLPTAARETAKAVNAYVVVKGAHSLVAYPDGRLFINLSGNDGMATPGSGDVLCGAIAAMPGLGLTLADAVRQGVFVHGLAGDLAAQDVGRDGMTASDIMAHLPSAVRAVRGNTNLDLLRTYGGPHEI